jgi:RNA polymerase sigma-70 factor (ECF subfamily)
VINVNPTLAFSMTSISHSQDRFATTRWSVVMHLASSQANGARDALAELARRYWYPVYSYARRCGHDSAIANDITRNFLLDLLGQFIAGQSLAANGHFRRFLLDQLDASRAGNWQSTTHQATTIEIVAPPPCDLEMRYQRDSADATSPEQAYQRSFALEVLARAFKRLHSEARKTGHLDMYDALEPFLGKEPPPGVYDEIAHKLQTRPLALVVALKRLRQRFRELVSEELADTVSSAEELLAEQQALHAILHEAPS